MSTATIEDAIEALEGALAAVDDSEARFKIRTALQFLVVLEQREGEVISLVEEECADDEAEVFDRLRELGYVE